MNDWEFLRPVQGAIEEPHEGSGLPAHGPTCSGADAHRGLSYDSEGTKGAA